MGSGFEHVGAAGGVDGEELGTGGGGGADCARDGVGDVVEFEVEEDGEAAAAELMDDGVAVGEVELEADFEPAAEALELIGEGEGGIGAGVVEGNDEAGIHGFRVQGAGCRVQRSWELGAGRREAGSLRGLGSERGRAPVMVPEWDRG